MEWGYKTGFVQSNFHGHLIAIDPNYNHLLITLTNDYHLVTSNYFIGFINFNNGGC